MLAYANAPPDTQSVTIFIVMFMFVIEMNSAAAHPQ